MLVFKFLIQLELYHFTNLNFHGYLAFQIIITDTANTQYIMKFLTILLFNLLCNNLLNLWVTIVKKYVTLMCSIKLSAKPHLGRNLEALQSMSVNQVLIKYQLIVLFQHNTLKMAHTKEILRQENAKDLVFTNGQMEAITKESGLMIRRTVRESFTTQMELFMKG